MLNTVVLLRDHEPSYLFEIDVGKLEPEAIREDSVMRRLECLTGAPIETPRKAKKANKVKQ